MVSHESLDYIDLWLLGRITRKNIDVPIELSHRDLDSVSINLFVISFGRMIVNLIDRSTMLSNFQIFRVTDNDLYCCWAKIKQESRLSGEVKPASSIDSQ